MKEAQNRKGRGRKPGKKNDSLNALSHGYELQTYIFRVLKEAAPEYGISKKAINMINEILLDSYDLILQEGRHLMHFSKK